MTTEKSLPPVILYPLPEKRGRAFSYSRVVEAGLESREYRSLIDEAPMSAEVLLDFKVWGKAACLTCYFRNIRNGEKFRLTAFDNARDRRYTPRDGEIDFSEPGIENGLYRVTTVKGRNGKTAWQTAQLLLIPNQKDTIAAQIAKVYCPRSF